MQAGTTRQPTCLRYVSRQVAAAQAALERGESGAAQRLEAAEEELERALEAVLDAECAGGAGFGGKRRFFAASRKALLFLPHAAVFLNAKTMTTSTTSCVCVAGGTGDGVRIFSFVLHCCG